MQILSHLFFTFFIAFLFSFSPVAAYAHGTVWTLVDDKSYIFKFEFTDGTPLVKADIEVFAPSKRTEPKRLAQTGTTDSQGQFAFIPTEKGKWIVRANDNAGHIVAAVMVIKEEDLATTNNTKALAQEINLKHEIAEAQYFLKIALVVSILFNIAIGSLYLNHRKRKSIISN